jgi:hypothetical protein
MFVAATAVINRHDAYEAITLELMSFGFVA